jgi:hypothetical protein
MDRGRRVCKLALMGLLACVALLAIASGAQARRHHGDGHSGRRAVHHVRGVVVHHNARAGSFVVASSRGRLFAIHAANTNSPALGSYVSGPVRHLRNHTFGLRRGRRGLERMHVKGSRTQARVHGTVSHVNGAAKTFVVSAEGVSIIVKGRLASALPAVGKLVTVTGTVDDENEGEIEEEGLEEEGQDPSAFDIEGTILEVNATLRTLKISADDDQASGESVIVHVPTSIEPFSMFQVGQEIDFTVTPLTGGEFELVSTSSDEGEQGAEDDQGEEEGDQGDDEEESEEEEEPGEDD